MIYETESGASDGQLLDRLDFHGAARRLTSWHYGHGSPLIVVGTPGSVYSSVPAEVETAALTAGDIQRSSAWDRSVEVASYSGEGVVQVGAELWHVRGGEAHENQNHDFVARRVRGEVVRPVEPARLQALSDQLLEQGEVQRAMVLAHFAGQSLKTLDAVPSNEAADFVLWMMSRLRIWSLRILSTNVDKKFPYLVSLRISTNHEVKQDYALDVEINRKSVRLGGVPRAGSAALTGLDFSIPSPDGPLPPD